MHDIKPSKSPVETYLKASTIIKCIFNCKSVVLWVDLCKSLGGHGNRHMGGSAGSFADTSEREEQLFVSYFVFCEFLNE